MADIGLRLGGARTARTGRSPGARRVGGLRSQTRQQALTAGTPGDKVTLYDGGFEVDRTVTSSGPLQTPLGELHVHDLGVVEVIREWGPSPGIRVETTIEGSNGDRFVALSGDLSVAELRDVLSTIHEVC